MGLLPDMSNCGCACAGNIFPATAGKQSRHASRHVRDARAVMHTGIANSRFPLNSAAGGNVPSIPGALKSKLEMPHRIAMTIHSLSQHIGTKYLKPVTGWKPVPASRPTTSCDHFYISVRSADVSDDIRNEDFMYRAVILITVTPLYVRTKYGIKFIHVVS